MKRITLLLLIAVVAGASCKEVAESHMAHMAQMRDSVFKNYPSSVAAVTINVQDNNLLIFTLGSKKLAKASDAERQQIAADLGAMALRILGKDSGIDEAKLIITPNERNEVAEPADGVVTKVDLDSLNKSMPH